jgi:hypothetical protein
MAKDNTGMSPKAARKLFERTERRLGLVGVRESTAKPADGLSNARRLQLALGAAWEIEALARAARAQLSEVSTSDLMPQIHLSAILDRMIVVSEALIDVAQPGEGDAAELEKVLRFAPAP